MEFVVFTREPFQLQRVRPEAERMRRLGMTYRAIGAALGVDEKVVRGAMRRPADPLKPATNEHTALQTNSRHSPRRVDKDGW